MVDCNINALAMVVRHARQRHDQAVAALDAATADAKSSLEAVEIAEDEFQLACDALLREPKNG